MLAELHCNLVLFLLRFSVTVQFDSIVLDELEIFGGLKFLS